MTENYLGGLKCKQGGCNLPASSYLGYCQECKWMPYAKKDYEDLKPRPQVVLRGMEEPDLISAEMYWAMAIIAVFSILLILLKMA